MKIKLTNAQVKDVQSRLHRIIDHIDCEMNSPGNKEIDEVFFEPLIRLTADLSDKVLLQTMNNINEIEI